MAFLVLAFPNLQINDYNLIQNYREKNDELFYTVVEPHFTIVFPIFDLTKEEFRNHICEKLNETKKINFTLRCSTINKDSFNEYYHTFLVPDEGYSQIIKLHDKLYCGKLRENLRLDIDFVPHIGIGNSKNKFACKKIVDELNEKEISINGTISNVTLVEYVNDKVTKLEDFELL
jgi:2'-5' RNA ligase